MCLRVSVLSVVETYAKACFAEFPNRTMAEAELINPGATLTRSLQVYGGTKVATFRLFVRSSLRCIEEHYRD